jgi:ABC-2 type transport system permease protein
MHRLSKGFFLGSVLGAMIAAIGLTALAVVAGVLHDQVMLAMLFAALGVLALLYGSCVSLVLWYLAWSSIQDGKARTTPGRAVGFTFIPVFNFYWIFQAIWGFAKDYNAFIRRHNIAAKPLSEGFFLFFTILTLLSPFVSQAFALAGVAGIIMCMALEAVVLGCLGCVVNMLCSAVNALPEAAVNVLPGVEPVPFVLPMRSIKTAVGAVLVLIMAFSGISICQNLGKRWRADITQEGLYTLSRGTKAILGRLNQPIKAKLFYAKTAALKGPDQIRYFNNYYEFVDALLEEYVAASHGMVELEVIDPRPFSDEEEQAMRYGLRRFPITEEENFFFGLVIQTQFGVEKTIPFFSPDRQKFVEYDISYLIDTAITKQKKKIGVLSSLPVMGQETSDYMARMMQMQGQQPEPPWTIVEQLRNQYEVTGVPTDTNDINDVDVLLVIHPKDLPEKTQFAIDQFVLKGGRTIVCVDPHCFADRPQRNPMQMSVQDQSSNLERLLRTWGLEMPKNTFAGDRGLAIEGAFTRDQRPEKIIGYLGLTPECFNKDIAITADLNQVRMLFAGVLREIDQKAKPPAPPQSADANKPPEQADQTPVIHRTPLVMTTPLGNTWSVASPVDLMFPDPAKLMGRFMEGTEPVKMGYLVTGRFKSSFPDGIEVEEPVKHDGDKDSDPNAPKTVKKHVTGLTEATEDCAVVVFSDVDFISDSMAYANSFFGKVVAGDNSALLVNAIEDLSGSGDLISIRSRGNYRRPFTVVDKVEQEAEKETSDEVAVINAQIDGFNQELQKLASPGKDDQQQGIVDSSIVQKKRDLELKIHTAQRRLRAVQAKRVQRIDRLGGALEMVNVLSVPGIVMGIALVLGIWRSVRRRRYISHTSDA